LLKGKLTKVSETPWFFQTAGSILAGVAGSMFVTILSGTLPSPPQSNARVVAWSTVIASAICSILSFVFAEQQRDLHAVYVSEVVQQMKIIENRYETVVNTIVETFTLISARYGGGGKFTDVTEILRKQIRNSTLIVAVGNHLCGDPNPGFNKTLIVKYSQNGVNVEKIIEEGGTLKLPS
jgi:hypothetical protein